MANTRLTRAAATPTSPQKATMSFWIKRSGLSSAQSLIDWYEDGNNFTRLAFQSDDVLKFSSKDGNNVYGQLTTNRNFRDTSGWYNIIVAIDTTQATASNRMKMYINGVQETSFSTETQPVQNRNFKFDAAKTIGANGAAGEYYNGSMSFITYVDGTQELPTVFGSTDSTTGEWKINTSPSATYGNNGFLILKNGNSVTDQSGSSNDFAYSGGTLTNTKDCPDNVFSTLNPLIKASNQPTFTNANTTVISPSGTNARYGGTLGMTSGKYYYEVKLLGSVTNGGFSAGMLNIDSFNFNSTSGISSSSNYIGAVVNNNNLYIQHGGASNDFTPTVALGSIIGHAIDMDNGYYYVHVNGVYLNSGDPTSGDTGTGNINRTGNLNYDFSTLTMAIGGSSQNVDFGSFNFGNGTFGTTAVSSAGTNASANGVFEYDVPTGYTALSTKGLNL